MESMSSSLGITSGHLLADKEKVYGLQQLIALNATSMWTYALDTSTHSVLFTDYHFLRYKLDPTPYCYQTYKLNVCETEIKRSYILPASTILEQFPKCNQKECISNIPLPKEYFSAIKNSDITSPLHILVSQSTPFYNHTQAYSVKYSSQTAVTFSWKPVYLQVTVRRHFVDQHRDITYIYTFGILFNNSLDAIFNPIQYSPAFTYL
ncbi:hypothetical protein DSO57_1001827 [Entomophthora muscae]|uniref:Uncharacterized protein n=1 Tax=Entomophthora muscae TaxID=34485 RepID=A0ACC2U7N9_9FUNG|nr:hypothetical protein DSO57_1001827 [Entomophthora muscae]